MWQQKTVTLIGTAILLGSCGQPPSMTAESEATGTHVPSAIAQLVRSTQAINTLSAEQVNRTVRIKGQVQQQAPLLDGSLYLITDDTGAIWVQSTDTSPVEGTWVAVEGQLQYEQIMTDGADISEYYLSEQSRSLARRDSE